MYTYIYIYIYIYIGPSSHPQAGLRSRQALVPVRLQVVRGFGGTQTGSYQTGSYQKGRFIPPKPKLLYMFVFDTTPFICL